VRTDSSQVDYMGRLVLVKQLLRLIGVSDIDASVTVVLYICVGKLYQPEICLFRRCEYPGLVLSFPKP
jgi:hypothetical protein